MGPGPMGPRVGRAGGRVGRVGRAGGSGGPKMDVISFTITQLFWKTLFLKKSTFYKTHQARNQDENDRKWII